MYGSANIKFMDGRKMEETMRATYLGGIITHNASRNMELNNRISIAFGACNKLKLFWRKTNCSIKWKLQIYNAIIVAQLTYGLCTLNLRLDAFQIRGLRYILGIEHSFYSHVTNEEIYRKTNLALNKGQDLNISWEEFIRGKDYAEIKQIEKISDFVMRQQNKLFGHIGRAENLDLLKQPTIDRNFKQPHQLVRRVGQPRMGWVKENCKYALKVHDGIAFDDTSEDHTNRIKQLAENKILGTKVIPQ